MLFNIFVLDAEKQCLNSFKYMSNQFDTGHDTVNALICQMDEHEHGKMGQLDSNVSLSPMPSVAKAVGGWMKPLIPGPVFMILSWPISSHTPTLGT